MGTSSINKVIKVADDSLLEFDELTEVWNNRGKSAYSKPEHINHPIVTIQSTHPNTGEVRHGG